MNNQLPNYFPEIHEFAEALRYRSSYTQAPSELSRKEDELLEFADVVFTGGKNRLTHFRRRNGRNSKCT